jgi:hypothetical protein
LQLHQLARYSIQIEKEKPCKLKSRMGTHPSKYKANEDTSRHNPKKKQKQTINKNQVKTLCKKNSWLQTTTKEGLK